jgi:Flp pilus assembly pilin Flp
MREPAIPSIECGSDSRHWDAGSSGGRGSVEVALVHRFLAALRDAKGQGLAEYALILALIAIVAIIALIFLGTQVSGILSTVGASV